MRTLTLTLALALTFSASAQDWTGNADVKVIEILTTDEDGDLRETKVWFVLLDETPYLRTSRSRWLENLRRDPALRIRIGDEEFDAHAVEISDDAVLERVHEATREKYGWQERMLSLFRWRRSDILRIDPAGPE